MISRIQHSSPVVIGGMGGSGTRVIAQILINLGFYMGRTLSDDYDNLWFTLLFKRPSWFIRHGKKDKDVIFRGLGILTKAMTGFYMPSPIEDDYIMNATAECVDSGLNPMPLMRGTREIDLSKFIGWGWKEPNSHIYIQYLYEYFKRLKYIHVIRHGLDMAFSNNKRQLFNWGELFGVNIPKSSDQLPKAALDFWIKANQRVINIGKQIGKKKYLLVNFDKLCRYPKLEIQNIIAFLEIKEKDVRRSLLCELVKSPKSIGRYKKHDLGVFRREDLEAVRGLGFSVEE